MAQNPGHIHRQLAIYPIKDCDRVEDAPGQNNLAIFDIIKPELEDSADHLQEHHSHSPIPLTREMVRHGAFEGLADPLFHEIFLLLVLGQ